VNSSPAFQSTTPIVLPNEGTECRSSAYILHGKSKQLTYITFSSKNIKGNFIRRIFEVVQKNMLPFADAAIANQRKDNTILFIV